MSTRYPRPRDRGPIASASNAIIAKGPQAAVAAYAAGPYVPPAPNAALLIDFDNVTLGIQKDLQAELRALLASDIIRGKVSVQRAYADWRRYPNYVVPLTANSIDLVWAVAGGMGGSTKKNATDIRLAIDAMELVFTRPEIGTFILLSGDSDFSSLVLKLKEYGKYVIGVGIRESASDLLIQNCDEYYSYNALAGLVRTADEVAAPRDPWELVVEAVDRMARNGDTMRADRLKQVMQDIDPSFDEKNLGMPKFSRFVSEAANRGLLTLTRLDSGQYEIAPARPPARGREPQRDFQQPQREPQREQGRATPRDAARDFARDLARGREQPDTFDPIDAELADRTFDEAEDEAPEPSARGDRLDRGRSRRRGRSRNGRDTDRAGRTDEFAVPPEAVAPQPPAEARDIAPVPITPTIGVAGERLTRAEAFDVVRRATEALAASEDARVAVPALREQVFALLGRDSESLSERMFPRIVQDAGENGVVRTFRDGDTITIARAPRPAALVVDEADGAAPVAQPAPTPPAAPTTPVAPRGMGPRGVARGRGGRLGAPPPELLLIGAVPTNGGSGGDAAPPASTVSEPAAVASPAVDTVPVGTAVDTAPVAPATTTQPPPAAVAPELDVAPAVDGAGTDTPEPAAEPAEEAEAAAAAPAGRGRRSRGRGRGRGASRPNAPTPESAPEPAVAPPAAAAPAPPPAAPPAPDADVAPARGRGARKTPAKTPAKTAAKRGARKRAATGPVDTEA